MTILRYFFFKMLFEKIAFQFISVTQRYLSRKCAGNKIVRFSLNFFLYLNQLIKKYRSAPDNRLQGRLDNNYYEACRPHNLTVRRKRNLDYGTCR